MTYQKNDVVILTIDDIGSKGEGIGKIDGYTLFVKDAILGDTIRAKIMKSKKQYGFARLEEVITPSSFRVIPKCALAKQCGGCQLQAMSYEQQLTYKQNKVKNHLVRIGKFLEDEIEQLMEPIIGMEEPYRYRNKAQFPIGKSKDGRIIAGFYAERTHYIVENTDCLLGVDENQIILKVMLAFLEKYHVLPYDEETGKGLIRHVLIRKGFTTEELMVCLVINGKQLLQEQELVVALKTIPHMTSISLNYNNKITNVILGEETKCIWGKEYIEDWIGAVKFRISPQSFYQVNPVQTKVLYELALEYANLTGAETVWDLYCGIGTISLFLAQSAKHVYGVEIVPQAIEDARQNAQINEITNVTFYVGKAEEVLPAQYAESGIYADVIVVDPPRKGCDEACLSTMVEMAPKRIVYVSCDSATLARDMAYLCENGYQLEKVQAVDQFGHTVHVETVCLLSHKDPQNCSPSK
ncbi:MAG: 23S rRNA (uracil(1939)-C(5))-methyltransferase RlmD [Eubacteriales bacterium]